MKVVITEKPSVARDLAAHLGATRRENGYWEGNGYRVSWALGHLVGLCEPEDYHPELKRWSLDTLPYVPPEFRLKLIGDAAARRQFDVVKQLLKSADEIICATDAGREGELIFRYILEKAGLARRSFRRLWLNSLNPAAIRRAFQNLRPGSDFDRLYAAARCRSQADWIVGLNATRNYTVRHGGKGMLWSAGRVQTPVLALIVHRDDEIRVFRPEAFFELWTIYREVPFKHDGERFARREKAEALMERVQGRALTIRKIEQKRRVEQPPQLYDLTDLQRDMNRRFGLSADGVLKAAQRLYEAKAITYPRTDSRYITTEMKDEVRGVLQRLRPHKPAEIGKLTLAALAFTGRIVNNQKVSDHHAILPTGEWPTSLGGAEAKVFDAVVTRLIAAFYPPCIKLLTTVHADANQVPFRATGVQVLEPGWTELYPRKPAARSRRSGAARAGRTESMNGDDQPEPDEAAADAEIGAGRAMEPADDQPLPEFQQGESGPHQPYIRQGETKPPPHFTENTLLAAMETAGRLVDEEELKDALKERGLGTPATRASIIETLLSRGYVRREKKNLVATDEGRYLIALVRDARLKSAELTGEWEARLKRVEQGALDAGAFMKDIVRYTEEIVQADDRALLDAERLGNCPRCDAAVIEGKRDFGCSRWREGCTFVLRRQFENAELSVEQVRHLLQRRILSWPPAEGEAASSLLYLSDTGAVFVIPKPSARPRRSAGKGSFRKGVSRSKRAGRDRAAQRDTVRPSGATDEGKPRRAVRAGETAPANADALGACPVCGQPVLEQKKAFSCSGWRDGCPFVIWKSIAGKRISRTTARTLLFKGAAGPLKGFRSKAGKAFDARLRLEGGRVQFDFSADPS